MLSWNLTAVPRIDKRGSPCIRNYIHRLHTSFGVWFVRNKHTSQFSRLNPVVFPSVQYTYGLYKYQHQPHLSELFLVEHTHIPLFSYPSPSPFMGSSFMTPNRLYLHTLDIHCVLNFAHTITSWVLNGSLTINRLPVRAHSIPCSLNDLNHFIMPPSISLSLFVAVGGFLPDHLWCICN